MELLTCKDVAATTRLSPRQIWKLLASGRLPSPVRISRSCRWRGADISRWVSMGCPTRDVFEAHLAADSTGKARPVR